MPDLRSVNSSMKKAIFLAVSIFMFGISASSQSSGALTKIENAPAMGEAELKRFYDEYADDLIKGRGEQIANRYDARGYYSLGNGSKKLVSFDDAKRRYTTGWTAPKSFAWKDMSFELLSPTSATVTGLFDWERPTGEKLTLSYSGVLTKQSDQWRIRVEDESFNSVGYATTPISGDRSKAGPFKYSLTAQPGTAISAHRHTSDMKITVKSGRKFILMGDLDTAKVQIFEKGSTFTIPANTWHVEWWENETVEEIEMKAPTSTIRAVPATPRS